MITPVNRLTSYPRVFPEPELAGMGDAECAVAVIEAARRAARGAESVPVLICGERRAVRVSPGTRAASRLFLRLLAFLSARFGIV